MIPSNHGNSTMSFQATLRQKKLLAVLTWRVHNITNNKKSMDICVLLDSCSWYDIGNFLQTCIKDIHVSSLLVSKIHCCKLNQLKSRVNSHTVPHYMHALILHHFRHLNFHLSRSLKVKCDGGIGLPIYDFLLVFNSNIWIN